MNAGQSQGLGRGGRFKYKGGDGNNRPEERSGPMRTARRERRDLQDDKYRVDEAGTRIIMRTRTGLEGKSERINQEQCQGLGREGRCKYKGNGDGKKNRTRD